MSIILFAAASAATLSDRCTQTHYLADGRVIVSKVAARSGSTGARSESHGGGNASSSVSVSSSGNGVSAASSSSSSDGHGRSVSMRRDATGCTIVVDDRPNQE